MNSVFMFAAPFSVQIGSGVGDVAVQNAHRHGDRAGQVQICLIGTHAALEIAVGAGIPTVIINGTNPEDIYRIIEGRQVGTFFCAEK